MYSPFVSELLSSLIRVPYNRRRYIRRRMQRPVWIAATIRVVLWSVVYITGWEFERGKKGAAMQRDRKRENGGEKNVREFGSLDAPRPLALCSCYINFFRMARVFHLPPLPRRDNILPLFTLSTCSFHPQLILLFSPPGRSSMSRRWKRTCNEIYTTPFHPFAVLSDVSFRPRETRDGGKTCVS